MGGPAPAAHCSGTDPTKSKLTLGGDSRTPVNHKGKEKPNQETNIQTYKKVNTVAY